MKELVLSAVTFYSQKDEEIFFGWFKGLESVLTIIGKLDDIVVTTNDKISDFELRELLAIFRRYSLDMWQLAQFRDSDNAVWFQDRNKTWYASVFEAGE